MKKVYLLFLGLALVLSGCVARTYQLTQDRVDQSLSEGNRGYIMGSRTGAEPERKTERTVRVFEFELGKSQKVKEAAPKTDTLVSDYVPATDFEDNLAPELKIESVSFQKYKVEKNDTLQKISQKFYGTTKKWPKIYEANRDTLKASDKLYPGQVLNIPEEGIKKEAELLKETTEKIK
ncbi:MAG: LysM peptidoglycan-binding domain-containing protein [Candidatus Omnitrophica bacterium]|nr:LysM peptidoglycan-binding domain-containing protein [Candidatus Omnitrophota bacterium]